MRLTTSNTLVSTTTSFDLIENNQPKRALVSSMSTTSVSGDGQTAKLQNDEHEQEHNHQKCVSNDNVSYSGNSSRGSIIMNVDKNIGQTNGHPNHEKASDIIIDPLTIATIETKPQPASSSSPIAHQLSGKSSPTTSS